MTLAEVGDILNISRERVRQIEEKAIEKVKAALQELGVEPSYTETESIWDDALSGAEED